MEEQLHGHQLRQCKTASMLQLATGWRALLKLLHLAAGAYSRLSYVARYAMLATPVVQVTSPKGARQLTIIEFMKVTKHNLNAA